MECDEEASVQIDFKKTKETGISVIPGKKCHFKFSVSEPGIPLPKISIFLYDVDFFFRDLKKVKQEAKKSSNKIDCLTFLFATSAVQ